MPQPLSAALRSGEILALSEAASADELVRIRDADGRSPLHIASAYGHTSVVQYLLDLGSTVDVRDGWGLTALTAATILGHLGAAGLLLKSGADPNARSLGGFSPLHWAVAFHRRELFALLAEHGAELNAQDARNYTPLQSAACFNAPDLARQLLELGADANFRSQWIPVLSDSLLSASPGFTALSLAFQADHFEVAQVLLEHGASYPEVDLSLHFRLRESGGFEELLRLLRRADGSQIHHAALTGDVGGVARLIAEGVDLERRGVHGATPLTAAIRGGSEECVALLLTAGARLDTRDGAGFTPLQRAVERGDPLLTRALLASGASPILPDERGIIPLYRAAVAGHEEVAGVLIAAGAEVGFIEAILLGAAELVNRFLEEGASVSEPNHLGVTPLMAAAARGDVAQIQELVRRGAEVEPARPFTCSPLHWTIRRSHLDAARLLLRYGADPNRETDHFLPLVTATIHGNLEFVGLLLEYGADPNTSGTGQPALCHAISQGSTEIACALLDAGADPNPPSSILGSPLHQAVACGAAGCVRELLQRGALPDAEDSLGRTPLGMAEAGNGSPFAIAKAEHAAEIAALLRDYGATRSRLFNAPEPLSASRLEALSKPLRCLLAYFAVCPRSAEHAAEPGNLLSSLASEGADDVGALVERIRLCGFTQPAFSEALKLLVRLAAS